jgi:hypothetical protein
VPPAGELLDEGTQGVVAAGRDDDGPPGELPPSSDSTGTPSFS